MIYLANGKPGFVKLRSFGTHADEFVHCDVK